MADPVTILFIVNGSLSLALKIGTVIRELYNISQKLKQAQLTILSAASECETVQTAWSAVLKWAQGQPDGSTIEPELLERLGKSLKMGNMVISAFEDDLLTWNRKSANSGFLGRSKIAWEEATFSQHQFRIRGQAAAMTLLLQVINL
jgi:Asp/Glu/hydantoin racemase